MLLLLMATWHKQPVRRLALLYCNKYCKKWYNNRLGINFLMKYSILPIRYALGRIKSHYASLKAIKSLGYGYICLSTSSKES